MLDARGRVHFLGDDQRFGFEIERNSGVGARCGARALDVALGGFDAGNRVDHGFQVFGRCAAAAAHDADAVVLHKMLVILGQFLRRQFVDRVPADVLRQTGVRQHRNFLGGIQRQVADRVVHLLRTGRAIQPDGIHVERFERGQRRADLGAQQHGSGFLQRDLHRHRQPLARFPHGFQHADGGDLGLQQILRSLDQKHVDAAFNQSGGLLFVRRHHRVETDVPERRQFGGWPHRSRDESRLVFRRELLRHFLGELRGLHVDLVHAVAQIEFAEDDSRFRRRYWSRRCRSPRGKNPHECRE